ncbi:MAG: dynamin family protein [Propionicimonas sp.]|nr:dynamin family protein [Propionicimonas sp.]
MTATTLTSDRLDRLTDLVERFELTTLAARLDAARQLVAEPERLTVAVLGQFKAGKSSLLNSLSGTRLLPVLAVPATAVVSSIRHADRPAATVSFGDGRRIQITDDEIADYVVEQRNPNNVRGVARVELATTGLATLPDLTFVDTPGLGSAYAHNTATSLGWLPQAGTVILAVSATQPLGAEDLELLQRLTPHTPHIVLVVTKADLVTRADLDQVLGFVASQVRQQTGRELPVVAWSVLSDREDLRADLLAYLTDELQARHRQLAEILLDYRLRSLEADCRTYLGLALGAAEADEQARLRLTALLDAERARFPRLRAEVRTLVRQRLGGVRQNAEAEAVRVRDTITWELSTRLEAALPTWQGSLADESARFRAWLTANLQEVCSDLPLRDPAWLAAQLEPARGPLDGLAQGFAQRLGLAVQEALGIELQPPSVAAEAPAPLPPDITLNPVFDSHLELLSWLIPMRLVRPIMHRHFRRQLPWEVEKNLLRLAYASATRLGQAMDELAEAYLAAMDDQLATWDRLSRPDDGHESGVGSIRQALHALAPTPAP